MATRTVRLDEESERLLTEIRQVTGLSVSAALKRGLIAVRDELRTQSAARPFEVYREVAIGPGGDARGSASRAKEALPRILRRKTHR